jgi:hypothetical protein
MSFVKIKVQWYYVGIDADVKVMSSLAIRDQTSSVVLALLTDRPRADPQIEGISCRERHRPAVRNSRGPFLPGALELDLTGPPCREKRACYGSSDLVDR